MHLRSRCVRVSPHSHPPHSPTVPNRGPVYRRRRPTQTPLYPLVQQHLETFLAQAAEGDPMGDGVPSWVERDFRAYLRCGILAHGFARARCSGCGYDFLVAFSCKGRGVCPSCNARRMVETAAHLVDHVLPPLPVRQWVLSVPKRIRPFLHHNPAIAGAVLRIFLRAIRTMLRRASPGAGPHAQIGAISFLHRFGASLNAHFHFHVCVIDGVFGEDPEGSVQFHEATRLTASDWNQLQHTVRHRVLRYFHRHGLLERHVTDDMLTWQASGGFSVDASVHIAARDRAGLERLLRYCARPPFALERIEATGYGVPGGERIVYRLPRPAPDGAIALSLTPLEFLERLALLIHPPRIHRHRYHGVLAPNAKLRYQVIALRRGQGSVEEPPSGQLDTQGVAGSSDGATPGRRTSSRWAALIARIYEILPLVCPSCGASMRIIAFVTDPVPVHSILTYLDLPSRPPLLSPARAPPQTDFGFDQSSEFDPTDPEPLPEFEFDQSLPD